MREALSENAVANKGVRKFGQEKVDVNESNTCISVMRSH